MFINRTRFVQNGVVHSSSVDELRNLVRLQGQIVNITPIGYKLSNGVRYCSVGLKGKDGVDYLLQAYGDEALELHNEAWMIKETIPRIQQ
jgi:hypothetical protein